jgi:hypothetical protein
MSGGLPRTKEAMRLVVESCVTWTPVFILLNFATKSSKYGMTSGFVSSNRIELLDPHALVRKGTVVAIAP